jgi:hypothetical protein
VDRRLDGGYLVGVLAPHTLPTLVPLGVPCVQYQREPNRYHHGAYGETGPQNAMDQMGHGETGDHHLKNTPPLVDRGSVTDLDTMGHTQDET